VDAIAGPSCHVPLFDLLQESLVEHMHKHLSPGREASKLVSNKGWLQAQNKRVTNSENAVLVRDYAYTYLKMYRTQVQSKQSAEQHLLANAYGLLNTLTKPDPGGVENCFPPSVAACSAVLGVPELQKYEVHLCPRGCIHWWFYMPKFREHFRDCRNPDCPDCVCPHCKAPRYVKDKKGVHGAERCWFFFDCLHVKALDVEWSSKILRTQRSRDRPTDAPSRSRPTFYSWPECQRLLESLPQGSSRDNVRPLSCIVLMCMCIHFSTCQSIVSMFCHKS
jgi:hypothetical protein